MSALAGLQKLAVGSKTPEPATPRPACPHAALGATCLACEPADADYRIVDGGCSVDAESLLQAWRELCPDAPPPREVLLEAWHALKGATAITTYVTDRLAAGPGPAEIRSLWHDLDAAYELLAARAMPGGCFRAELHQALADDPPPASRAGGVVVLEVEFVDAAGYRYLERVAAARSQIKHIARVVLDLAKRHRWTAPELRHVPRSEYMGGAR